jgi:hypothetical protein
MSASKVSLTMAGPTDRAPLSYNQQFLCMFDRGDAVGPFGPYYHISGGWRIGGRLDADNLQQAFDDVIARHEALRTVVVRDDPEPHQRIFPPTPVRLRVRELAGVDPRHRDLRCQELLNDLEASPYPIGEPPLLRAFLWRFDDDDALLVIQAHHTAADAWSIQLIMREVAVRCAARTGHPVPALPAASQYQDFARWQQAAAEAGGDHAHDDYWREKLRGGRVLALRTDWPRSLQRPQASAWLRFAIDRQDAAAAREIARKTRSTAFMVYLAAYLVCLHRTTGASDVVVPTFTPGRPRRFQDTIGSFFNLLPLRTELAGCGTFTEVVERTRQTCVEAYSREVPFGRIVQLVPEVAAPMAEDDLAMFNFQAEQTLFALEGERVGGLTYAEVRRRLSAPVGGDVPDGSLWTMSIDAAADTLGSLAFNTNRYDPVTTAEMVIDFRRTFHSVVTGPDRPLASG